MKKEEITIKNTKTEILDALNQALEREKNSKMAKSEPEKQLKEIESKKAVDSAKESINKNIFSDELVKKFKDLEYAIETYETRLKDLYGIEKEMSKLTLIVNAEKDYLDNLEIEKKAKINKINEEIKTLEEEYKSKTTCLQNDYNLLSNNLKIQRERENEEYNYKIKREREISNNDWEDVKKKRETDLKLKEKEVQSLLNDVSEREKKLNELDKKVNEIPINLEKEYKKGMEDKAKELEKENKYVVELLKKDFQSIIDRQNDKIVSLEEELKKEMENNKLLQDKMDKAYLELKDIATKSIESSGVVKVISNNSDTNKI